jgi:choline dehydrogenase
MPRIIRGHTHAPTVMIAERAADLIRASNHKPEPATVDTA